MKIPARELAALNKRLGSLARKVVNAQEDERLRVSRELHDEAGQALTALKLNLEMTKANLSAELNLARSQLDEAIALTDQTMEQIRLLAHNLRPQAIDALGFNSALSGLCEDFTRRTPLNIHYTGEEIQLPDAVVISFYRFLQEALTNVAKHAQAEHVSVYLEEESGWVVLAVSDDGIGFAPLENINTFTNSSGLGLTGMQERFELLGGWIEINSKLGEGTRLVAAVPTELHRSGSVS